MEKIIKLKGNIKGLTLVETVIAIIIAAITLVGFLQVCNTASLMMTNIKYRMRAVNIAQAELEDLMASGYSNIDTALYTPYKKTYVIIDEGLSASSSDDIIGEMRTTAREVTSSPNNGKTIAVLVIWDVLGEHKREIIETLIYSRR